MLLKVNIIQISTKFSFQGSSFFNGSKTLDQAKRCSECEEKVKARRAEFADGKAYKKAYVSYKYIKIL